MPGMSFVFERMKQMSRDTSPQARINLAQQLWQLAHTDPGELAEEMYTNDLAVEILRAGLDLYVQQVQEEDQDKCTVSLPLYEWDLLAILLEVSAKPARFCQHLQNPPTGAPEWIPGEHQSWDEQAVTQPRYVFHDLITLLDRLHNHFNQHIDDEGELAQWVPDLEMRRALMKRYYAFTGTPEDYGADLERDETYQNETHGGLMWYLARRIETQIKHP
jgi:hypothetical protein